jgi:hypothetical protein
MSISSRSQLLVACLASIAWNHAERLHAAGLNVVPPLPDRKPISDANAGEVADDFWGDFWNGPGGYTWKDFNLQGGINYKGFYTDNAETALNSKIGDFVNYVTPRLLLDRPVDSSTGGTGMHLAYQPTFILNTSHSNLDRNYQALRGDVEHLWNENSIVLGHIYQKTSEGLTQSGVLAPQELNDTQLSFGFPLTGKIRATIDADRTLSQTDPFSTFSSTSTDSWQLGGAASIDLLPKTTAGLRFSSGYSEQRSSNVLFKQTNERILTQWHYILSGKMTVGFDAGVQLAPAQTGSVRSPDPTPRFGLDFTYLPRFGTSFQLVAGRTSGSAQLYSRQNILQTTAQLNVRQRVFESFALIGGIRYMIGEYELLDPTFTIPASGYNDLALSAEVQWRINARFSSGVFYQYQTRSSQRTSDVLNSYQVGLTMDFRF